MKKYLLLLALVCLLGNGALAQTNPTVTYVADNLDFSGYRNSYNDDWGSHTQFDWDGTYLRSIYQQENGWVRRTWFVSQANALYNNQYRLSVDNTNNFNIAHDGGGQNDPSYLQFDASRGGERSVSIHHLGINDKVTIQLAGGTRCYLMSNNTDAGNPGTNGIRLPQNSDKSQSLTISNNNNDGVLVLKLTNEDGNYPGIRFIGIQVYKEVKDPRFDYDPGYEEYDMYDEFTYKGNNNNSQSSNDTQFNANNPAGFDLNGNAANYITFTKSKISANNRIAVDQSGTWRFNYGLRPPTDNTETWSNFSVCNLRTGDRVVVSYMGGPEDLVFSSAGNSTTYNGCAAFVDKWNDGVYHDNGQVPEDQYISGGMPVQIDWQRNEGNISPDYGIERGNQPEEYQLYYTKTYVIAENGHLDFGIKNGPVNRLVKIKIYSDHQAMMVDDYVKADYRYTAHFNISGELQIKEHIMPGGLEIHIGNDNPNQHAIVVASQKDGNHNLPIDGYVSYVNAVDGYKIPGVEKSSDDTYYIPKFDLAPGSGINSNGNSVTYNASYDRLPTTGTYYVFKPEESGKMKFKFKANSMNYYRWDLAGNAVYYGDNWQEIFDRPNEQTLNVKCPYYLVTIPKATENNPNPTPTFQKLEEVKNGEFYETPDEITVQEGYTYYLYGAWNATDMYFKGCDNGAYVHNQTNGTTGYNSNYQNNIEWRPIDSGHDQTRACGVAELLWVDFTPERSIYPLAKWVPNGTTAVKEGEENGVPDPDDPTNKNLYVHKLADVQGYKDATITVKKMSGNIVSCHPYIWRANENDMKGELRIDNIVFAKDGNGNDKNPGGTILIKIGNPEDKSEPLYTLTIAYSAEQKYDEGNTDARRGHTWDFSTNSLQGLTWGLNQAQITAGQTFTYPQADTDGKFYNPGDGGYAVEKNLGNYFSNYFGETISNYSSAADVMNRMPKNTTIASDGWPASLLYDEIEYQDEHGLSRSDWMFNFNLVNDGKFYDPIFVNKYDMEGDNADMIWNSEGMVFQTSSGQSGIFDEYGKSVAHNTSETIDPDRYIGIMEGGKFRIPWLMPNDRVIIYMGIGTLNLKEQAKFSIKNAFDAVHNSIDPNDDYIVGGSHWDGANGDPYYRGCYHFFAKGDGQGGPADMVFEMKEGPLCKIYKIQIYRGDRIITNEIKGATSDDKFLLVSTEADPNDGAAGTKGDPSYWTLKYFGKDQKLANGKKADGTSGGVNNDIVAKTGNITKALTTNTDKTFTYPHDFGEIGTFRARGKDMEKNMKYVADYADHNVTVAYQQTMEYPYTWDFMDMTGYKRGKEDGNVNTIFKPEDAIEPSQPDWFDSKEAWDASYEKSSGDLSLWETQTQETTYYLRLNSQSDPLVQDNIFETAKEFDGNQVWANGAVVPEAQGLWFYTEDNNQANGGQWIISDAGMQLNGNSGWPYTLVVPNVPKDAAVYLRLRNDANNPHFNKLFKGEGNFLVYGPVEIPETASADGKYMDYIFAIMNNGNAKRHLVLSFGGYQLKKLAVSTDPKTVNIKGYATESRDHDIDTRLTSYLTGKDIKTYLVGGPDYANRTLTLAEVSQPENTGYKNFVLPGKKAVVEGETVKPAEGTGCVLYNSTEVKETKDGETITTKEAKILNGGFHLFVPDMHDRDNKVSAANLSNNMLKANLDAISIPATETVDGTKYTNYILTYKYYKLDKEGNKIAGTLNTDGPEIFYRVANGGATGKTNTAYLPLPTASVDPSLATNVQNPAKFTFIFADDLFGQSQGITTAVENIEVQKQIMNGNAEWYNLNGQKLNGKPSKGGLYIINGKKVLVK